MLSSTFWTPIDNVEGIDPDGCLASGQLQDAIERQLTTFSAALAGFEDNSPELAERIPDLTDAVRRGNHLVREHESTEREETWKVALPARPEQRRVVLSVLSELNREDTAPELRGSGP